MRVLTELHRHLDVSIRFSSFYEIAQNLGICPLSTSMDNFRNAVVIQSPMRGLDEALKGFEIIPRVFANPLIVKRLVSEACLDAHGEGLRYVEFRFSPSFMTMYSKLDWDDLLDGIVQGVEEARLQKPQLEVGLICIASREFGFDAAQKTVDFFQSRREAFVGFDIAGPENQLRIRDFAPILAPLLRNRVPITIHAGEAGDVDSVWEAIEFCDARRIGHGLACVKDVELMRELRERRICVEVSLLSNYFTGVVSRLEDHPIKTMIREGIDVCLNTDDPTIFATTIGREIETAKMRVGLSDRQIDGCFEAALRHRFA